MRRLIHWGCRGWWIPSTGSAIKLWQWTWGFLLQKHANTKEKYGKRKRKTNIKSEVEVETSIFLKHWQFVDIPILAWFEGCFAVSWMMLLLCGPPKSWHLWLVIAWLPWGWKNPWGCHLFVRIWCCFFNQAKTTWCVEKKQLEISHRLTRFFHDFSPSQFLGVFSLATRRDFSWFFGSKFYIKKIGSQSDPVAMSPTKKFAGLICVDLLHCHSHLD